MLTQSCLMNYRIIRRAEEKDSSKLGFAQLICNSLLLVGVAQATISMLDFEMEKTITSCIMSKEIISFVKSVMKPVSCFQGQSLISPSLDAQIKASPVRAEGKNIASSIVGSKPYCKLHFSPNVLSLFLETRADPALRKVYLMSPRVNHRNLHLERVWHGNAIGTDENPGIIATLLELGDGGTMRDTSLKENYIIFPYTVKERSEEDVSLSVSELVFSEHVLAHQKQLNGTNRIVAHIDAHDVKELWDILRTSVCKNCFRCVNKLMLYLRKY
jgi:hypothetical protein